MVVTSSSAWGMTFMDLKYTYLLGTEILLPLPPSPFRRTELRHRRPGLDSRKRRGMCRRKPGELPTWWKKVNRGQEKYG